MKIYFPFLFLLLISCNHTKTDFTAQKIIDNAVETAGADLYENAEVTFTFRNIIYKSVRQNKQFSLQRILPDTLNTIDILTNEGFYRLQKSERVSLPDSLAFRYMESVNSVHYFNQLPYGLNDPAVQKKLLPSVSIKGKDYFKVEITFSEEGGGVDFEDIFLYWISKDDFTVDYLAYQFFTNEGGIRFRESYNPRVIEGIRFVDYKNFRPKEKDIDFYKIDELFENDELVELSLIETEKITVRLLK
ncbi:MAG: deoxyribose-phosphate aldolase [Flavobacteriaceae bacterium]|nr:deoxyribose-phosphate aldolase [Flavobacteriaceae bacterium]